MGILGTIGKVVGLDDLIGEIGETVRQVLPNEQARRDFDLKLEEIKDRHQARIHEQVQGQLEVNKTEAAHESIFVAGWRPFIGWVCGVGIAWNFAISPLLTSLLGTQLTVLDVEYLVTLVVTMLGASGIRTFERVKGVSGPLAASQPVTKLAQIAADAAPGNAPAVAAVAADNNLGPAEEENAPWNRR